MVSGPKSGTKSSCEMGVGKKYHRLLPRLKILLFSGGAAVLLLLAMDALFPVPVPKSYSQLILARDGSMLNAYLSEDDKWRMHTSMDEVPEELVEALVAKEDRWFWYHSGVNPLAIGRAAVMNVVRGRRASGASTITMQLARMMEPKARTWTGKLREALRAMQLEWHYSKREIMEMYLSYLPYGGNIEGVKAASLLYLDRPPERLSLSQCVLLTVIPNRPNSLRPDQHPAEAAQARNLWIERFRDRKVFEVSALNDALQEAIPQNRMEIPALAPQFCTRIRSRHPETTVTTTLDLQKQLVAQSLLQNHVRRVRPEGVSNGAVLVLDNRTHEVVAYCGSADFEDKAAHGEVNGALAWRSPGSTLKPLIYAMSFDRGLLTPHRRLLDIPTDFSGYNPVNYDQNFQGEVTVEYALRHSLNLPAVRALNALGIRDFMNALEQSGFRAVQARRKTLGLSLALGGCESSLEELVRLYSAFACGGRQFETQYVLQSEKESESEGLPRQTISPHSHAQSLAIDLCTPEAAWLIADILSGLERPDFPRDLVDRTKLPRIAWKTGTSFGRRDAWAIGFNPRYTIGVWMGNMNGASVPSLSGARTSVPLLVDLFNAIDHEAEKNWFPQPGRLRQVKVCSQTGLLPAQGCEMQELDYHLHGVTPAQTCDRYREILTDPAGKVRYCTECLPPNGFVRQHVPIYPPELLLWYDAQNISYQRPPVHNPDCEGVFYTDGPKITSPAEADEFYVAEGQELLLQARPEADAGLHYWFANDRFLGAAAAGSRFFFRPPEGMVTISCLDDKGRMENVTVQVNSL